MQYMEQIGVRELTHHAGRWLRRVAEGATCEITVRGVPVARLSPLGPPSGILERLAAEGHATLATKNLSDVMKRTTPIAIPPSEQLPSLPRLCRAHSSGNPLYIRESTQSASTGTRPQK